MAVIRQPVILKNGAFEQLSGTDVLQTQDVLHSNTTISLTGSTSLTQLVALTVSGNTMGANGFLRITIIYTCTNNANNKTLTVLFGSQNIITNTVTASTRGKIVIHVYNRNATNVQGYINESLLGATVLSAHSTAAVDTTVDQNVTVKGQLANAADTLSLEFLAVEILP